MWMHNFMPNTFINEPERRWLRAGELIQHGNRPGKFDDASVGRAWKFRRRLVHGHLLQHSWDRHLAAAHSLYDDDQLVRWQLEAWLLAGLTIEQVADKLVLEPETVSVYEQVFFAVADHMNQPTWIDAYVLHTYERFNPVPEVLVWREAGVGGPALVELLLDDHHGRLTGDAEHYHHRLQRFRTTIQLIHAPQEDKALVERLITRMHEHLRALGTPLDSPEAQKILLWLDRLAIGAGVPHEHPEVIDEPAGRRGNSQQARNSTAVATMAPPTAGAAETASAHRAATRPTSVG